MKNCLNLKVKVLSFICFMVSGLNALATEPASMSEMPQSCRMISPEKITFELPLPTQKITQSQKERIYTILSDARTQACILQMQYDGLLQQIIAMLFENRDVTTEQLQPFYDQLTSLTQNRIENKLKTIISIRKLLSQKEWQDVIAEYTRYITAKNEFIKQQTALHHSTDALISGDKPSDFMTSPLISMSYCIENTPKIEMLEQIISKLPLTNSQEGNFRNVMRLQETQSCAARQEMDNFISQFITLLAQPSEQIETKQYQALFNQLITKEYLLESYQLQTLSSLFQFLTVEQRTQLKEKYMLLKGLL
ncbi:unnamed protein product [Commensalibacter communis]|uniref:DUF2059 domain-containing protein n=1 Tax=Commensalibacter communis TaxID=2972786 RepID=A0A9W4XH84_9PROT|nr:hypothetical protein [Commensalibacter communis]CAI3922764.1 unnamed protein product [Commensalibacter communis]CAI3930244.1 unnamed protein product [Commensalibacter communis]CAI3930666.1 unnamed protein product [Commensalibacter communis]CAI3930815.1 unnamed protein product [Commensalibacter communis]CAI3932212.1 unnamed protein product [Commensalibacter communis]